jgi:hypothetical protein
MRPSDPVISAIRLLKSCVIPPVSDSRKEPRPHRDPDRDRDRQQRVTFAAGALLAIGLMPLQQRTTHDLSRYR